MPKKTAKKKPATKKPYAPPGFTLVSIGDEVFYVKHIDGKGNVRRAIRGHIYDAYDTNGEFLGYTPQLPIAEAMVKAGFINCPQYDDVNDLDMIALWNAAVSSGSRVLMDEAGTQIIHIKSGLFMTASDFSTGFEVGTLDDGEMQEQYYDHETDFYCLTICPKDKVFTIK